MNVRFTVAVASLVFASCSPAERPASSDAASAAAPSEPTPQRAELREVEATVARVVPGAKWDHYSEGAFEVFDAITFAITAPAEVQGRELIVYYAPDKLASDSPLRTIGTRCRFRISAGDLEPPAPGESRELYAGALEDVAMLP